MDGRDNQEAGMDTLTRLYLNWVTSQDLLQSTGPLLSAGWQPGREGVSGRRDACTHMAESLCRPPEAITTLLIGYTST